jgi:hypothetical protein
VERGREVAKIAKIAKIAKTVDWPKKAGFTKVDFLGLARGDVGRDFKR